MVQDPKSDLAKLVDEVAAYSIYWLSNHILLMDKKYTVFFEEHGIV
jgi:hemerythrin